MFLTVRPYFRSFSSRVYNNIKNIAFAGLAFIVLVGVLLYLARSPKVKARKK